jgi:hypothetical protein
LLLLSGLKPRLGRKGCSRTEKTVNMMTARLQRQTQQYDLESEIHSSASVMMVQIGESQK